MAAYGGPEPMSFEEEKIKTETKTKIPADIETLIAIYKQIVDKPDSEDLLWSFVKSYLTYLEKRSNLVIPFFGANENLMESIYKKSQENTELQWGVYKCFLTISDIGSKIAIELNSSDDSDENPQGMYYIMYVMLSFDSDSPVFQFTTLLKTLMEHENIYNVLNNKFLKAFEMSVKKPEIKPKAVPFLSKTVIVPIYGKEVSYKLLLIILVILLLIIGVFVSGLYYKKGNMVIIADDVSEMSFRS